MPTEVTVSANARLHMGFLDLHGGLGRQFGSIGVAVNGLRTIVSVQKLPLRHENGIVANGADARRAKRYAQQFCAASGCNDNLRVHVHEAIVPHAGLGSGTQMALAVGMSISRLMGRADSPEDIAIMLGRGKRSAIGISCFKLGGFVVDGGKRVNGADALPPTLTRLAFPADWRLILLLDKAHTGMHGAEEFSAMRHMQPLPAEQAAHLCRLTLMRLLPGLVEANIQSFGAAVTEVQKIVGDHFAPVQGGRYTSPAVSSLLSCYQALGAPGLGQSSWGPTGFVLCETEDQANEWMSAVASETDSSIDMMLCSASNEAATVVQSK